MLGAGYDGIKIAIFKTLRRLYTTWKIARSIIRVSTHEHEHWEHCVHIVYEKEIFWTTHVSSCISGAREVDPRVRPSGRRIMVGNSSSLVPYECMDKQHWRPRWKGSLILQAILQSAAEKIHVTSRVNSCCWKPVRSKKGWSTQSNWTPISLHIKNIKCYANPKIRGRYWKVTGSILVKDAYSVSFYFGSV